MFEALLLLVATATSFGQLYRAEPDNRVPILPIGCVPWSAGGWVPPPGPPSAKYIQASLAAAGRRPGDVIAGHQLDREEVGAPRFFRGVGRAQVWRLTYRCEVNGPDGPYVVYTDRTALIRVP
ncbi:hypothetical protein [Fimbriiglobus ruber]|uniref:Uncharacterized protein n=1 Tax=Fimbriiglobus ruber TaxID=1908690 RepID=A0A225E9J7_9BACT|nr:hypothetical protein [Fimbriiglobus ruber]OWK45097.1 hypothetical protein FRUB_01428 [Fimbriiglobus ruber]